ncbi:hypothetical protein FOA52_006580 [Chlamydomonas sp. UWO 241]|nr:hypothetical protein FOA52_006580 [Chlamydomonas sp. UWO 241]
MGRDGGRGKRGTTREDAEENDEPRSREAPSIGDQTSGIKNKLARSEMYAKLRHKAQKTKKMEKKKRQKVEEAMVKDGLEPPPKRVPKTIESTREKDETMVQPDDEEVEVDEDDDEFAEHFKNIRPPKVLITTCYKPSKVMYTFLSEMLEVFPAAQYYKRAGYPLKKIVKFAAAREYTDVVVFNEDRKSINAMLVIHLPDGPTARFRLSNLKLGKDIKGHGRATEHKPELILNNFGTRLGRRVGRMFASLFCQDPNFRGRRVITFHNQRDYIFFRHHRYIFEEKSKRSSTKEAAKKMVQARLQELGPRFTLKLEAVQKSTFDSKEGEFEWVHKKDMDTSRRRFFL